MEVNLMDRNWRTDDIRDRVKRAFNRAYEPAKDVSLSQYVEGNLIVPPSLAIPGPINLDISPHFREPLDALGNEFFRTVVVAKPVRGGGSLIGDLWLISSVILEGSPIMSVFHDEKTGLAHSKSRYVPMLREWEKTSHLLSTNERQMNYEMIPLKSGVPWWVNGPATGRLQAKGVRFLLLEEAWRLTHEQVNEARGRLGDFSKLGLDKCLFVSQAGAPNDPMDMEFNSGSMKEWAISCPECRKMMVLDWINVRPDGSFWGLKWDQVKDQDGNWKVDEAAQTVRFECEHCAKESSEDDCRDHWVKAGRYIAQNPDADPEVESFRWTAIIDTPWTDLVKEFLKAKNRARVGVYENLIAFFQKKMVIPSDVASVSQNSEEVVREVYDVKTDWEDEFTRIITVDRQGEDVYWVMVRAWAKDGRSRRLYFGKAYGGEECEELRKRFKVRHTCSFIDSGSFTKGINGVYVFCIKNGWIATKGVALAGGGPKEFIHKVPRMVKGKRVLVAVRKDWSAKVNGDPDILMGRRKLFANLFNCSTPTFKDHYARLAASGAWVEPRFPDSQEMELIYKSQITAEVKKTRRNRVTGLEETFWQKTRRDNHALDLAWMQCFGATFHGVDLAAFHKALEESQAEAPVIDN